MTANFSNVSIHSTQNAGASLTGTVTRFLGDRLGDIKNVRDFGAVGDGSTNDQAAIQAAVNAAYTSAWIPSQNFGVVFFPAGNYKINSTISVDSSTVASVLFQGVGQASQILGSFGGFLIDRPGIGTEASGGLSIHGFNQLAFLNQSTNPNAGCLRWNSAGQTEIRNCLFSGYTGVNANDNTFGLSIIDCWFTGPGFNAIPYSCLGPTYFMGYINDGGGGTTPGNILTVTSIIPGGTAQYIGPFYQPPLNFRSGYYIGLGPGNTASLTAISGTVLINQLTGSAGGTGTYTVGYPVDIGSSYSQSINSPGTPGLLFIDNPTIGANVGLDPGLILGCQFTGYGEAIRENFGNEITACRCEENIIVIRAGNASLTSLGHLGGGSTFEANFTTMQLDFVNGGVVDGLGCTTATNCGWQGLDLIGNIVPSSPASGFATVTTNNAIPLWRGASANTTTTGTGTASTSMAVTSTAGIAIGHAVYDVTTPSGVVPNTRVVGPNPIASPLQLSAPATWGSGDTVYFGDTFGCTFFNTLVASGTNYTAATAASPIIALMTTATTFIVPTTITSTWAHYATFNATISGNTLTITSNLVGNVTSDGLTAGGVVGSGVTAGTFLGGSFNIATQNYATNSATAAGSNVLHFAANTVSTAITNGMFVQDTTTAGVIPINSTVIGKVTGAGANSITISNNVTGGGVLNGDNISVTDTQWSCSPSQTVSSPTAMTLDHATFGICANEVLLATRQMENVTFHDTGGSGHFSNASINLLNCQNYAGTTFISSMGTEATNSVAGRPLWLMPNNNYLADMQFINCGGGATPSTAVPFLNLPGVSFGVGGVNASNISASQVGMEFNITDGAAATGTAVTTFGAPVKGLGTAAIKVRCSSLVTLVTNNSTASTNTTLHIASVPVSIVPGMIINDISASIVAPAITNNTVVVSTTATTVTMSIGATASTVLTGDTITFALWTTCGV